MQIQMLFDFLPTGQVDRLRGDDSNISTYPQA